MQRRKDLTAVEGHVVLLEYFEEFPLLLGHPGMGARLTSYYRRRSPTDNNHQQLLKGEARNTYRLCKHVLPYTHIFLCCPYTPHLCGSLFSLVSIPVTGGLPPTAGA